MQLTKSTFYPTNNNVEIGRFWTPHAQEKIKFLKSICRNVYKAAAVDKNGSFGRKETGGGEFGAYRQKWMEGFNAIC